MASLEKGSLDGMCILYALSSAYILHSLISVFFFICSGSKIVDTNRDTDCAHGFTHVGNEFFSATHSFSNQHIIFVEPS